MSVEEGEREKEEKRKYFYRKSEEREEIVQPDQVRVNIISFHLTEGT